MSIRLLSQKVISLLNAPGHQGISLIAPLTDTGDNTGNPNMIGSYSLGSPGIFYSQPPVDEVYSISKIQLFLSAPNPIALTQYGSISALTNGVNFAILQNSISHSLGIKGNPIKTTEDWAHLASTPPRLINYAEYSVLQLTMDFDINLILDGSKGDRVGARMQDDVSGLSKHNLIVYGCAKDLT
jgi:hypothetical protein